MAGDTILPKPKPTVSKEIKEKTAEKKNLYPQKKPLRKKEEKVVEEDLKITESPEEEQEILNTAFENLEFESGKDIIKDVSFPSLEELANLLIKKSKWKIIIAGHTDNVGSAKSNLILSKKRSQAVGVYLEQRGVKSERIIVQYFGEEKPVADNNTKEGRQQNRRVEMTILFE